jgi:hypothetical protein
LLVLVEPLTPVHTLRKARWGALKEC